jgi:CheY-like chemotaxis protein
MSGCDFRAKQLADPMFAPIPVVLLSAATNLREHAGLLKVDEYLAKPIELDRLYEIVRRYCW